MSYVRLKKFVEDTNLPCSLVVHLMSENQVPLRVDSDGYLELEITEQTVQWITSALIDRTASGKIDGNGFLGDHTPSSEAEFQQIVERTMREQFGEILNEALDRLTEES